jgi:hypothetical protein
MVIIRMPPGRQFRAGQRAVDGVGVASARGRAAATAGTNAARIRVLSTAFGQKPLSSENAVSGTNHASSEATSACQAPGTPRASGERTSHETSTNQPTITDPMTAWESWMYARASGEKSAGSPPGP